MVPSTANTATSTIPASRAEAEHLAEEIGERLLMAGAKARDRRVIGDLVGADHPKGDVLATAALDPARGALADRVGVGEQADHHLRLVGGGAVAVGAVGGVERLDVELVDRLDHEPGEVIGGQPVTQVGRQQQRLVAIAGEEVLSHARMVQNGPDSRGFMRQPPREAGVSL